MTDTERGFQDGKADALLRIKRVAFGKWQGSTDYATGYTAGQRAGLAERQSFDSVVSNPKPRGSK